MSLRLEVDLAGDGAGAGHDSEAGEAVPAAVPTTTEIHPPLPPAAAPTLLETQATGSCTLEPSDSEPVAQRQRKETNEQHEGHGHGTVTADLL